MVHVDAICWQTHASHKKVEAQIKSAAFVLQSPGPPQHQALRNRRQDLKSCAVILNADYLVRLLAIFHVCACADHARPQGQSSAGHVHLHQVQSTLAPGMASTPSGTTSEHMLVDQPGEPRQGSEAIVPMLGRPLLEQFFVEEMGRQVRQEAQGAQILGCDDGLRSVAPRGPAKHNAT